MHIDPSSLDPRDRYRLMIRAIVPRPIAFVSTVSPDGAQNLAPFSYFTGAASDPMTLLFCPANRPDGAPKDSHRNALPPESGGTGEFVVNAATETIATQVALAAEPLEHGESEFDLTGLTPVPSSVVSVPRVQESPVAFECRTRQVIELAAGVPGGGNVVIGEVVGIHVNEDVLDEQGRIDADKLSAIGRMGGLSYTRTRDRFDMKMGR